MVKNELSGTPFFSGTQCSCNVIGANILLQSPLGAMRNICMSSGCLRGPDGTRGNEISHLNIFDPSQHPAVAATTQKRKLGREAATCPARLLPRTAKQVKTVIPISHPHLHSVNSTSRIVHRAVNIKSRFFTKPWKN